MRAEEFVPVFENDNACHHQDEEEETEAQFDRDIHRATICAGGVRSSGESLAEILHEITKGTVSLQGVPEGRLEVDVVVVPSALAGLRDDAVLFELAQDPNDGSLGDAHFDSEFADENVWLS